MPFDIYDRCISSVKIFFPFMAATVIFQYQTLHGRLFFIVYVAFSSSLYFKYLFIYFNEYAFSIYESRSERMYSGWEALR